jgi:hypothetical protein
MSKRKRILAHCSTRVNRNAVRRVAIDGVEHIVISSRTLPDDIVMNGGLYPAEEIDKSFKTLERTLAPVEHPQDSDGNFIPAADPTALHNYYAGAFNQNVKRENGRVNLDKVINVQEARKTDRGRRLLDRVSELETNSDPRPIHTSTGVFVSVEVLDAPKVNAVGQEYTWIAREMVFDHDAILLDSVGAAQPSQGVGMGVNSKGDKFDVHENVINIDFGGAEPMSHSEIRDALQSAISKPPLKGDWVLDIFDNTVVFESDEQLFSATYILDGRVAKIVGVPVPVSRDVTYVPITNRAGDAMKEAIVNALKAAGIKTDGLSDDELLAKYNALQTPAASGNGTGADDDKAGIADVVANAIKPLVDKVGGLEAKINQRDTEELDRLADIVGNSEKYSGINVEAAKKLGVETLKELAANCAPAYGIPALSVVNGGKSSFEPLEMPK